MKARLMAVLVIALALMAGAACGGDDDDGGTIVLTVTPSAVAQAPTRPAATATPATPVPTPDLRGVPSSGIDSVDRIIAAVLADDEAALRALVRFTPMACTATPPMGLGGPPMCRPNEADGAVVDVFPISQCEGSYQRPDELGVGATAGEEPVERAQWPIVESTFYAAYRAPQPFYPPGPYALVFVRGSGMGAGFAWELVASDDGIVGMSYGCGASPGEMVAAQRLTSPLIPPQ